MICTRNIAVIIGAIWAVPVHAMTACDLPKLIPMTYSDYERVSGQIHQQPGCVAAPTTSAHSQSWTCSIKFNGDEESNVAGVLLIREPNTIPNLVVMTTGLENLNSLRACDSSVRNHLPFNPLNIVEIDHVKFRSGGSYYLNSFMPSDTSLIISNHSDNYRNKQYDHFFIAQFGFEPPSRASTAIRFAGMDPFKVPVQSIVNGYIGRGSQIIDSFTEGKAVKRWELTPPVGVGGVTKVEIKSVARHFASLKYHLGSKSDYLNFVEHLDLEYGTSDRVAYADCSLREWDSGDVRVIGRYCPEASEIEFINMLAVGQAAAAYKKIKEREQDRPKSRSHKSEIDRDMM